RRHVASALALTLLLSATMPVQASGIPVVDGASIADRAIKHAATMGKFIEQIEVLRNQLESQRRQLESLPGTRNLGEILNNPSIRALLPDDARSVLRGAEGGDLQDILKRLEVEERLTGNYETDRRNLDIRAAQFRLRSQALMEQTQEAMTARM